MSIDNFKKIDIRVGKIIDINDFPESRKPSYKLKIDLGNEIGIKNSCAQLVRNYNKESLRNKQVLCLINIPSIQIGTARSEVLILGVPDTDNNCVLIIPDKEVTLGAKLY